MSEPTLTQKIDEKVQKALRDMGPDRQEEKRARTRFGLIIIGIALIGGAAVILLLQGADWKILLTVIGMVLLAVYGAIAMSGEWAQLALQKFFVTLSGGVGKIMRARRGDPEPPDESNDA